MIVTIEEHSADGGLGSAVAEVLTEADKPIMIDMIDSPYANNQELKNIVYGRGL